jgi:hypothetical protein
MIEDKRAGRSTPSPQAVRDETAEEVLQQIEAYVESAVRRLATDVVQMAEQKGPEAAVDLARASANEEELARWRANERWLAARRGASS